MPSRSFAVSSDTKPQTFNFGPKTTTSSVPKKLSESEAARATQKGGSVTIAKKEHMAGNHHSTLGQRAKKLDDDTENYKHKTVDHALKTNIQRYRQKKGLSQTELGKAINERTSIVTDYESGKAIPNESVLVRMEKALGVHLRGAKAGQEFAKPAPKADAAPKKA